MHRCLTKVRTCVSSCVSGFYKLHLHTFFYLSQAPMHTHAHMHTYTHANTHTHIPRCGSLPVMSFYLSCTYTRSFTLVKHLCIHTHTCTRTHTQTHTHTQVWVPAGDVLSPVLTMWITLVALYIGTYMCAVNDTII